MLALLNGHLDAFASVAERGEFEYPWCHVHDGGRHNRVVVIGSLVHGDEVGSVPAVVQAIQDLRSGVLSYGGRALFFLGNPEAGQAGRRYLDCDLNRSFRLADGEEHEVSRARAITPLLTGADLLVDLHQTTLPPRSPFWIHDVTAGSYLWTRALGGRGRWVASRADPNSDRGAPLGTTDELVNRNGGVGLTFELGQKGFHADVERWARDVIGRAFRLMDAEAAGQPGLQQAAEASRVETFEVIHRELNRDPSQRLRPGLVNFHPVARGEQLSPVGAPTILAPDSGRVLFPSYPAEEHGQRPRYLYWLLGPAETPLPMV